MKKTKGKLSKPTVPKLKIIKQVEQVAMYVGDTEKYFPLFKKIVNKGDLLPEMPIDEAKMRRDFIVINKED